MRARSLRPDSVEIREDGPRYFRATRRQYSAKEDPDRYRRLGQHCAILCRALYYEEVAGRRRLDGGQGIPQP